MATWKDIRDEKSKLEALGRASSKPWILLYCVNGEVAEVVGQQNFVTIPVGTNIEVAKRTVKGEGFIYEESETFNSPSREIKMLLYIKKKITV